MDVGGWLRNLGLGKYEAAFRDNTIDEQVLRHLTAEDLKEIGVATVGDRRKLLAAIAEWAAPSPSTEARSPPSAPQRPKTPEVSAERRPITIMFCDLVGSTALASRLDAEDWRSLVNAYLDEASGAVNRLGGHVLKRLGDGLMALFGYPRAQENDAERAVRAALAIQRALGEMNARNAARGASQLSARIGLESGPVVVEATGEVFGEAPNVAARVQGAAEPGTVVVTAAVQRQTAGLFVAEEKGAHELKGIATPVTLYRIVRASGGRRTGARSLTPLVGREEELDLLRRRWERARNGAGQLTLIVGEPGIGKSRLVEEFRATLGATPHTFVELSTSQLWQNTPLHPIAEWGRQRFGADEPAHRRLADLENTLRLIGLDSNEYAPLIAPLVDIPLPAERAAKLAPEELRRRQLAALVTWFLAGARSQAVALAFEDLHWADPSSLDLMQALAERGAQTTMLILATARPEFRPPWSLRSHHSVISLSPLDRADVALMVGELASRLALSREVVDGVSERTGGVPLFIEEVTRLLLEGGEAGGLQAIPPTLQQSLAARLDRLGDAREVAQIGAVLGRDFTYALLAAVGEIDDPALESALDRLAGADLLITEGAGHEATYRFKHALIQDAAYDSLLKSRRQALHRRAAEILRDEPERAAAEPEVVAHHFTEAGLNDLAIEWWGKAGERSLARSALLEAEAHLTRALAEIAALPGTPTLRREQIKLQVALVSTLMHSRGYAAAETKASLDRARALIGRAEALGEPPDDPLTLFSVLYSGVAANYIAFNGKALHELAVQFLELANRQTQTAPICLGHRLMGLCLFHEGDVAGARGHFERAIALYDPASHRPLATRFVVDIGTAPKSWRALTLWLLGYPDAARTGADKAIAGARELGHVPTLMSALTTTSWTYIFCGGYDESTAHADELIGLADEAGASFWKAMMMLFRGAACALSGGASEAVEQITSALRSFRSTGASVSISYFLSVLGTVNARLGRLDEARRCIDEAVAGVEATGERWHEADIHRTAGEIALMSSESDAAKAQAYFERALEIARAQQARSWELRAATSLARLWRDQGKRQEAHDLLAPAYSWFTEGFDTLDLKEAKALLDELTS